MPTSLAHKRDTKAAATDALAGALSGAFSKTIAAPLDRIKLLVQLRGSIVTADGNRSRTSVAKQNEGGIKSLQNVIRNEGILSLWRGNTPTILIQGATSALKISYSSKVTRQMSRIGQTISLLATLIVGPAVYFLLLCLAVSLEPALLLSSIHWDSCERDWLPMLDPRQRTNVSIQTE